MRIALAAATALFAMPGTASAFDWTGFYLGAHGGGAFSDTKTYSGIVAGGSLIDPQGNQYDSEGWLAGVHGGFNFQNGRIVLGAEADASWSDISGTVNPPSLPGVTGGHSTDWFASLRGRLGTSFDRTLVYATGGVIFADYSSFASNIVGSETATASGVSTGWTAGAGIEHAITNNVTVRAEYLFSHFSNDEPLDTPDYPVGVDHLAMDADVDVHAIRVGVNYYFR